MQGWVLAFLAGAASALAAAEPWPLAALVLASACAAVFLGCGRWLVALGMGFACSTLLASRMLSADWPCARDREVVEVTGVVAGPAIERSGRLDFDLDVRTGLAGVPTRIRLSWYEPSSGLLPGECWRMPVRLRCRNGMANPGAPDRELDLLRQHISATGTVASDARPERLAAAAAQPVERLRARISAAIESSVPDSVSGAVLKGLSVGVRGNIPERYWDAFAATGLAHLIAISGLHVTGCAAFALVLFRLACRFQPLGALRARILIETLIVLGITAAYAALSGASLPALRTLALVAIIALLRLLRRSMPLPQVLTIAAFLQVAPDPMALTSAGFWLSYAATAALVAMLDAGRGWRAQVIAFAHAQAAVTAILAPVLAATFGQVSLIAPLANAVAIPFFSVLLLPAVLFATVVELAIPGAGTPLWQGLAQALEPLWPGLVWLADRPLASAAPAAQPLILQAGAALLMLAAVWLPLAGLRIVAAACLIALLCGAPERPAAPAWQLTVVDVGQGLAAVVETRRHVLVFDTGPRWRGGAAAARVSLLPYLRSRGIRRIDRLIVSHADQDHAGGLELLQSALHVEHLLTGPGFGRPGEFQECLRGMRWEWDGVQFEVLHPRAEPLGSDNDRSCALRVASPAGTALLLADPEQSAEAELVSSALASDVVLVPHHGSRTSSTPALVDAASARLGIASAGFGNRWGMPVAEVVGRWRTAGTTVLSTAEEGAITIRFPPSPGPMQIETERAGRRHWWRRRGAH